MEKKIVKHLKGDMKMFKKEAVEDKELIKKMKKEEMKEDKPKKKKKAAKKAARKAKDGKVEKVMREYKQGKLHSGSKKGPEVQSRKQAIAIALSEARKAGEKIPKKKKK